MSTAPFPLSILAHGDAGTGKSWFGDSAPAPRLCLDAEGRAKFLPSQPKVYWDPMSEAPPAAGDWQTCVVNLQDFNVLDKVGQWLRSGQHPFRSVIVDSLMEVQKRLIDGMVGLDQLKTQDWGVVLRRLEALVRSYRDLLLMPGNPVDVVCFLVGSKTEEGKQVPLLQGSLRDTLPYYFDVVGFMYVVHEQGGAPSRNMLVSPTQQIIAKDGTGRLGTLIQNPSLQEMFDQLNGGSQ
jgi:hypothetical protein